MHALNTLVVMQGFSSIFRNNENMSFNLLFSLNNLNLILWNVKLDYLTKIKSKILFVDADLHIHPYYFFCQLEILLDNINFRIVFLLRYNLHSRLLFLMQFDIHMACN